jgi:Transposase
MARIPHTGPIHRGLDVHRNTISVATLPPDAAAAAVEQIPSDEAAVLAFLGRFAEPARLRACYEAGPTGYELARLLHHQGIACQVIAPSLIPRAAGDKVKTDRRDSRRLARLYRAGELVAIRIPTPGEEAVRDLCRARADLVDDRSRARRVVAMGEASGRRAAVTTGSSRVPCGPAPSPVARSTARGAWMQAPLRSRVQAGGERRPRTWAGWCFGGRLHPSYRAGQTTARGAVAGDCARAGSGWRDVAARHRAGRPAGPGAMTTLRGHCGA